MRWSPHFHYGSTDLTLTYPMKPINRQMVSVGGSSISDGGHQETFVKRRDQKLALSLRVMESEWVALMNLIIWCHDNGGTGIFLFHPDATNFGLGAFNCWLDDPQPGKELGATPSSEYPACLDVTITVRISDAAVPDIRMFS